MRAGLPRELPSSLRSLVAHCALLSPRNARIGADELTIRNSVSAFLRQILATSLETLERMEGAANAHLSQANG